MGQPTESLPGLGLAAPTAPAIHGSQHNSPRRPLPSDALQGTPGQGTPGQGVSDERCELMD